MSFRSATLQFNGDAGNGLNALLAGRADRTLQGGTRKGTGVCAESESREESQRHQQQDLTQHLGSMVLPAATAPPRSGRLWRAVIGVAGQNRGLSFRVFFHWNFLPPRLFP